MARHKLMYGLLLLSVCAAAFTTWAVNAKVETGHISDPEPLAGDALSFTERAVLFGSNHVAAAGIVEPSSGELRVGTPVSGTVEQLFVTTGARVKKGNALFVIDARLAKAEVERRQSELRLAQAKADQTNALVFGLRAEAHAAKSAVEVAEIEHEDAKDLLRVGAGLKQGDTIATREMTRRRNAQRVTAAQLAETQAHLMKATATLALYDSAEGGQSMAVERAAVELAKAALAAAQTELDVRTVRAPCDGTILQVNVKPGEFARSDGASLPTIVMGQIDQLHVRVDIDELDMPRWSAGASASATPRGSIAEALRLTFVRREPMIVPKRDLSGRQGERVDTRVMQVIYAIEAAGLPLSPGQQLDVLIDASDPGVQVSARQ